MRRLLILVIALASLCGLAWALGSMTIQASAIRWLEARRAEGWVANASNVAVAGFPVRFVTDFTNLELADPDTGLAWLAPNFRLEQQVYRLDRLAAVWPETQTIASPEERLTLNTQEMSASLNVQPANNFALDAIDGALRDLEVTSTKGWDLALTEAALIIERLDGENSIYHLSLTASGFRPAAAIRNRLDPVGVLPERIDQLVGRADITFDRPWNLSAIEVARPQPRRLSLEDVTATWGNMLFRATGDLTIADGGIPEGEISVRAENWRAMVDLAENAGGIRPRLRPTVEAMLEILAGLNGSQDNIDARLSFSNGRVFLGPLPLGPAPSLRLR